MSDLDLDQVLTNQHKTYCYSQIFSKKWKVNRLSFDQDKTKYSWSRFWVYWIPRKSLETFLLPNVDHLYRHQKVYGPVSYSSCFYSKHWHTWQVLLLMIQEVWPKFICPGQKWANHSWALSSCFEGNMNTCQKENWQFCPEDSFMVNN